MHGLARWRWFAVVAGFCLAGCQMPPQAKPAPTSASRTADPCADSLHEICGPLLMYYAVNKRMPLSLEELCALGLDRKHLSCPHTGKPYVYVRKGIALANYREQFIVYDAAPHRNIRWAVGANLKGSDPLVTRVIGIPESRFVMLPEHPADTIEGPPPAGASP